MPDAAAAAEALAGDDRDGSEEAENTVVPSADIAPGDDEPLAKMQFLATPLIKGPVSVAASAASIVSRFLASSSSWQGRWATCVVFLFSQHTHKNQSFL